MLFLLVPAPLIRRVVPALASAALLMCTGNAATFELYHWVDENGVQHFSQWAPPGGESAGVEKLFLDDSPPPGFNPEEDRYHVKAQQEAMQALWDDYDRRRSEALDRRQQDAGSSVTVVHEYPGYTGSHWWYPGYPGFPGHPGRPPRPPKPPLLPQPEPPIESLPFRPPGRTSQR